VEDLGHQSELQSLPGADVAALARLRVEILEAEVAVFDQRAETREFLFPRSLEHALLLGDDLDSGLDRALQLKALVELPLVDEEHHVFGEEAARLRKAARIVTPAE
jgi:hypothetical protein